MNFLFHAPLDKPECQSYLTSPRALPEGSGAPGRGLTGFGRRGYKRGPFWGMLFETVRGKGCADGGQPVRAGGSEVFAREASVFWPLDGALTASGRS